LEGIARRFEGARLVDRNRKSPSAMARSASGKLSTETFLDASTKLLAA